MKTDAKLGKEIHQHLINTGCESPIDYDQYYARTSSEKKEDISKHMHDILNVLGFNLSNDSVKGTADRVARMWVDELMVGIDYNKFPKIMTFGNSFNSGMVIERNIQSMSLCSHHLVTVDGTAFVAYIPKNKVIGLSKINRVVNFFSRRPQEAERLTLQIYHALEYILETTDIAVFITGTHYCVKSRGVNDVNSSTSTAKLGGVFMNDPMVRKEFYDVVHSVR